LPGQGGGGARGGGGGGGGGRGGAEGGGRGGGGGEEGGGGGGGRRGGGGGGGGGGGKSSVIKNRKGANLRPTGKLKENKKKGRITGLAKIRRKREGKGEGLPTKSSPLPRK